MPASTAAGLDGFLDELNAEWATGVARLDEFERLYGNAEHVALLNRVGAAFFGAVQQILWDDLLLRVTRLTDRPVSQGKRNLSIQGLAEVCERAELPVEDLKEQVQVAVKAAEFARSHRNQRISHKDLDYAIGGSDLPSTTLEQIRGALNAVHAVLQTVNMKYRRTNLSTSVTVDQGVEVFLGCAEHIVDAVLGVDALLADLSDGAPAWDDETARDWIRRLGGEPSSENVRRIINLRTTAGWLRRK